MDENLQEIKQRIQSLLNILNLNRGIGLNLYLDALDKYSPTNGSEDAITRAGRLHDLDRHITNLELEIKRIEALQRFK